MKWSFAGLSEPASRIAATVLSLSLLGPACVSGQVTRGDRIPEALKSVPAAVGACRSTDPVGPRVPSRQTPLTPAATCAAASPNAVAEFAQRGAVLIDVRPRTDYQAFHIAGSLNAGTAEIGSKPYWRDASVVLIGNGKAEGELVSQCARLKQSGYRQIQVLRGGLPAWLGSGQAVLGNAPTVGQQTRLAAAEYLLESRDPDNLLLLDKEQASLGSEMPVALGLPETTAATIGAALERKRRKSSASGRGATVVLAIPGNVTDDQVAGLQRALLPVPLLVYAEGRDAVTKQQKVQKAMWSAYDRGPKQLGCGL